MTSQHLSAYQKMEVTKATHDPNQIILMLYDGALRFIKTAALAIEQGNVEKRGIYIGKTIDIIAELNSCLDRGLDDDLVPFLEGMYRHIMQQLLQANLKQDRQALAHVFKLVCELRRNWITFCIEDAAGAGRKSDGGTAAENAAGAGQEGTAGAAPVVRRPETGTPRPTVSAPAAPPQARAYARMAAVAAPTTAGSGTHGPRRTETTAATVTAPAPEPRPVPVAAATGHEDSTPPPYPATGTYGGGCYGRPADTRGTRTFTI
jgi:flagellar protein FliS